MKKTPVTEVIVIRHAQTLWNAEGRHQGHLDSDLSETGLRQAQALADRLAKIPFAALYTSDLKRAVQTAAPIAQAADHSLRLDPRLRERNYGVFRGLTLEQIKTRYPGHYGQFISGDPDHVIPEGESARQVFVRVVACATQIVRDHLARRVIIVAHGGVLDALLRYTCGIPLALPRRCKLPNGSLNTFHVYDRIWMLAAWGDTTHLHSLQSAGEGRQNE